jgi:hypothetical protein
MPAAGGVWVGPFDEIAGRVRRGAADGTETPRVDRLPCYERPIPDILAGSGVLPG